MAGFVRRYGDFPGSEVITQIEGVVIVDTPPPGAVNGTGVGTVAVVGEFTNMEHATAADSGGLISTSVKPQEVFSGKDLIDKSGPFDPTIGDFGGDDGNGFAKIRNKRFSRLVVVPVNLCSARGSRVVRQLPVCTSQTNADPVVPVIPGSVEAAAEFRSGAGRLKLGKRHTFTARTTLATGLNGELIAGVSAATQSFDADVGFDWAAIVRPDGNLGAREGDVLVIGYNNAGALAPSAEAGTYRVQTTPGAGTAITVERLDGANFAWSNQPNVPWRLHFGTDADSAPERVSGSPAAGGYSAADAGGYVVPIRPITDSTGAQTDGTFPASTVLTPAVAPPALTGDSADALSGLQARLHVGGTTGFNADLQGINRANHADLDAAYATAIDALLGEELPARGVNIVVSARRSSAIRTKLKSHVTTSSSVGVGRRAILSPALDTLSLATVLGDADPGAGANRHERLDYSWPGAQHFVPEAVGYLLGRADGTFTSDGILDDAFDGWLASLESNLAPEKNPGQASEPVPSILAPIVGIQKGVGSLGINEYIQLRAKGIAALRIDRTVGPIVQSGVTTSLVSGQKNINRRRFADFIQDSVAQRLVFFSKQVLTNQLKDAMAGEIDAFFNELLSPNNPPAQRISAYLIDEMSGNTPSLTQKGIHAIIGKVEMLATGDFIVFQSEVGLGVLNVEAA